MDDKFKQTKMDFKQIPLTHKMHEIIKNKKMEKLVPNDKKGNKIDLLHLNHLIAQQVMQINKYNGYLNSINWQYVGETLKLHINNNDTLERLQFCVSYIIVYK